MLALLLGLSLADTAAAGATVSAPDCPRQRDACVDRLLAHARNLDRIGCRHNAAFALLYLRTTERIRDAIRAGEFSDRLFWNQVTTAFGRYYLDALNAWRRGDRRHAPKAWRIAFRAAKHERVSTLGDVFLGVNAHVNRDLALVYFRLGAKNRDDHLFVDTVLTRTFPIASRRSARGSTRHWPARHRTIRRCHSTCSPGASSLGQRRAIRAAFPATASANRARNAHCVQAGSTQPTRSAS